MNRKTERQKKLDQHIGGVLRAYRNSAKINQKEVGKKLDVSFQIIQKYESGQASIPLYRIVEMSEIYGVSLHEVLNQVFQPNSTGFKVLPAHLRMAANMAKLPTHIRLAMEKLIDGYLER